MKTKNIFKTVALAMLMPAMLLTTACSNQDDVANTSNITSKGYALPVTVNATRGGDATRATFDGSKLNFSTGDKLFVYGSATAAGSFAGELTWQSGGTFSGTIYTQEEWTGTPDALFTAASAGDNLTATLLPYGYESTGFLSIYNNSTTDIAYDDRLTVSGSYAFVASETAKATGVEQLSLERTSTYSSGFALAPLCAILNFTITGLEAGAKNVLLKIRHGFDYDVFGSVTPNASGVATFAIGVPVGANIKEGSNNLTVGSSNFTLPSSITFAAGKIYNITRVANVINSQFSVGAEKKVYFSKGNLRYKSGAWSFFNNQYDYYNSYSADAWDRFGWSTSATTYGMNTSTSNSTYFGDFVDWGATIGTGWRTLTSDEWTYLFGTDSSNKRTTTSGLYFAKAKVNDVQGIILFPDTYTHPDGVTAPTGVNSTGNTGWNGNNYSSADWTKMESAGCVFLPAAGYRSGSSVYDAGTFGYYWSATPNGTDFAYGVYFLSGYLNPASNCNRNQGYSVRLVRQVTE